MSVRAMAVVWSAKFPDHRIKNKGSILRASTLKLVALAYADHADDVGHNTFPSNKTLSRKCSISLRSVQRYKQGLIDLKILAEDGWAKNTPRYSLNLKLLDKMRDDTLSSPLMTKVTPKPSFRKRKGFREKLDLKKGLIG